MIGHADRASLDGVPVTSVARTLVDLGAVRPPNHVRRAFVNAEQKRLVDMRAIETALDRAHGRRGARILRELLESYDPRWQSTRSELELMMLDLLGTAGLP